jgi:uncharacterized protein (DUF1501 family)
VPEDLANLSRRELLRAGLVGFAGWSIAGLSRLRAVAARPDRAEKTAVILVWLRGGASHLETFDPKPEAPSEYRGPYRSIHTNVPGIDICELLPQLAQIADKYTLLRSVAHSAGGHPAGSLQMLSGDPDVLDKPGPVYPDWMSVASYFRQTAGRPLPPYVAVNPVDRYDNFVIAGSGYLGPAHEPLRVLGDPSLPEFEVPNVGLKKETTIRRLEQRVSLKQRLDRLRREIDTSGTLDAVDQFERQALQLLTSRSACDAFDLSRESTSTRERYGNHRWGQQCLLARRLVEAGVDVVSTEFDGPLCGRVANWDDHAVNHHVFEAMKYRAPFFDQAVSALVEDIHLRGLERRVLLVVAGEFGRTPRISYAASSGGGVASGGLGTVQPGRDHWPRANSMLFSGGGITTGQVIGATDKKGEDAVERRVGPGDFLATLYHHLGIDYRQVTLRNFAGRPVPLVRDGQAIPELI